MAEADRQSGDGRELFYLGSDGKLMSVDIKAGAALESSAPSLCARWRVRASGSGQQHAHGNQTPLEGIEHQSNAFERRGAE